MLKIAIFTDSAADVPVALIERLNIGVVPITINWRAQSYTVDGDLTEEHFREMLNSDELPTTSQPPPGVFAELYAKALEHVDKIISIHVTAKSSGTCQAAQMGAAMLPGKDITVVDSQAVSMAQGWQVIKAACMAQQGQSGQSIVEAIGRMQQDISTYLLVPTLKYLAKGGRVPKLADRVSSILSIKPILTLTEGQVTIAGMTRSINKGLQQMGTKLSDHYQGALVDLAVMHADAQALAEQFAEHLKAKLNVRDCLITPMGVSLLVHGGQGMIGASVIKG